MSELTGITWCDHTFNPWWGCTKVSPGCARCYAERDSKRYGFNVWGPSSGRRFFSEKHWNEPLRWDRRAREDGVRRRVFCASMADVFEDRPDLVAERDRLFQLIFATPHLDWLLLTKRPENFRRMLRPGWLKDPRPNVWLGVSVEDQATADARIPLLLQTPAAVRFVSYEPALGPVDFGKLRARSFQGAVDMLVDSLGGRACGAWRGRETQFQGPDGGRPRLDWLIVGGESGPGARPFDVAWARSAIAQCKAAGVACFVKQLGAQPWVKTANHYGPGVDAHPYNVRYQLEDRKGGDLAEWPEDLRVREFPAPAREAVLA